MRRIALGLIGILLVVTPAWGAPPITGAQWLACSDGDTCQFNIPGWHPVVGRRISVRLLGIDAPEMHGRCEEETRLARKAREFLSALLLRARTVELRQVARDKYFRLLAHVYADGVNVGDALREAGLAREYGGGTRQPWCPEAR